MGADGHGAQANAGHRPDDVPRCAELRHLSRAGVLHHLPRERPGNADNPGAGRRPALACHPGHARGACHACPGRLPPEPRQVGDRKSTVACQTCHTQESCLTCHIAPPRPVSGAVRERAWARRGRAGRPGPTGQPHGRLQHHPRDQAANSNPKIVRGVPHAPAVPRLPPWARRSGRRSTTRRPSSSAIRPRPTHGKRTAAIATTPAHSARPATCRRALGSPKGPLQGGISRCLPRLLAQPRSGGTPEPGDAAHRATWSEDCLTCHSALYGRGFNPHGPGFDADKLRAKNPQMCTVCHGLKVRRAAIRCGAAGQRGSRGIGAGRRPRARMLWAVCQSAIGGNRGARPYLIRILFVIADGTFGRCTSSTPS